MERGLEPARACELGGPRDSLGRAAPARLVEPRSARGAGVCEHWTRVVAAREEVERRLDHGQILLPALGLAEPHLDEGASEVERETSEALAQRLAVAEIAER